MAKAGSNEVSFQIDTADGGTLGDITQYLTKIGDFTVNREPKDSTPFGVTDEQYLIGIIRRREPVSLEGMYDDVASGPDAVLNIGRVTHAVTRSAVLTFKSGKTVTGEVWITKYTRGMEVGEYHTFSAEVRFTGTITEA